MRRILCACAVAAATSVAAAAQDSTVTSTTKIETDDAKVMSLTGCLQRDVAGHFTLVGMMAKADDDLTTRTEVETDVDDDKAVVRTESETRVNDGTVGTAGRMSTFVLMPRENVPLSQYVGQQVQIAAIKMDRDADDAEVTIEEKTEVDPDDRDDSTKRTRTEIEIDKDSAGRFTVVTVKGLGSACR